jgi:hypothetical protein
MRKLLLRHYLGLAADFTAVTHDGQSAKKLPWSLRLQSAMDYLPTRSAIHSEGRKQAGSGAGALLGCFIKRGYRAGERL